LGHEWATVAQTTALAFANQRRKRADLQGKRNGEGGNRTHDTTIFSRVLYQLSYLAWTTPPVAALREG
jgi:hypothetical protein